MRRFAKRLLSGILAAIMLSAAGYTCGRGTDSLHAEERDEGQEYTIQQECTVQQGCTIEQVYEETEASCETAASSDEVPVYRLYNPNSGEHFYTIHSNEKDSAASAGWRYEGIGWYAPASSKEPVYRLFNPNSRDAGSHHYTRSSAERDSLVASGWKYEGIVFYSGGEVKLFRSYNKNDGGHNYTPYYYEYRNVNNLGWEGEGTGLYGVNADTNQGKMYTCKEIGNIDGVKFALASGISVYDYQKKEDVVEYLGGLNDLRERDILAAIYISGDIDIRKLYIKWNGDEGYRNIDSNIQYIPNRAHPKVYFKNGVYSDYEAWLDNIRSMGEIGWSGDYGYSFWDEPCTLLKYKYMKYKGYNKYLGLELKSCSDAAQSFDIYYGKKKLYTLKIGASKREEKCTGWLTEDMKESWLYKEILEKTSYNDNMSAGNLYWAAVYCVSQHPYGGNYTCYSACEVAKLLECKCGYPSWVLYCGSEKGNDYNNFYSAGPFGKGGYYRGHVVSVVRYGKDRYIWVETSGSGLGFREPWKPWDESEKPANDSIYKKLDYLRDFDNIYELMLGDYGIDITKFDPYDCNTWY